MSNNTDKCLHGPSPGQLQSASVGIPEASTISMRESLGQRK